MSMRRWSQVPAELDNSGLRLLHAAGSDLHGLWHFYGDGRWDVLPEFGLAPG